MKMKLLITLGTTILCLLTFGVLISLCDTLPGNIQMVLGALN